MCQKFITAPAELVAYYRFDQASGSTASDNGAVPINGTLLNFSGSSWHLSGAALGDVKLGLVGAQAVGHDTAFEVRAFAPGLGVPEDPVTGSLNAGLAQWLIGADLAPPRYVAAQGAALGRAGRVHVEQDGETVWIGGDVAACIAGTVEL